MALFDQPAVGTGSPSQAADPEKGLEATSKTTKNNNNTTTDASDDGSVSGSPFTRTLDKVLKVSSVEIRGVLPVPLHERTSRRYSSFFTLWTTLNINLLPITFGMLGPAFGLGLRDSVLVIVFFCLLTAALPAYLGTLGPKTGLRQMIQARFSYGRYLVSVPVLLNLATLVGFIIITAVIGGQCLSATTGGNLSSTVGIVIIGILAMFISFCGYRVVHQYERYAWIPALIAIVITTGCGGSQLYLQAPPEPATASAILSFGMIVASYMIPYAAIASDFTTYLSPDFPIWRLFTYGYLGLLFPAIPLMTLGAAIGNAKSNIPAWQDGYDTAGVGGILAAMLAPSGGFGVFVLVILALTLLGNVSATMYAVTLNFQIFVPQLVLVPRYIYSIIITAIVIPIAIKAADDFFLSLENFIALIAYWSASFVAVVILEHVVFRRGDYASYDHDAWNDAKRLPWGVAALASGVLSFALVVPSMSQNWYVGPIAEVTGDLGFEFALVVTGLLYLPMRALEKKLCGR
ncbi:permease for cytosine/purines, uracil, thiamine, allantoin-domain-containing protein [Microdochium trichocladiopsis]|uniref:Permease for cytosine/purines, uracil, thiamine, allantoin-domain-containing protein n=1 Tax=Microdochium trichocladiopsis TaxID=1682393 RepID=A0A9P8XU50_9PEZI|nr:permease for cytosine/purines, uracil, thiamine, allantoin-domain-containing protein [Microdochium trichocladiopsis]KAH7018157.1 permease for cytosine/purines, uracil, thiamine, allantoin-domain-containing protein [Microdochium trichocladiopsis]